MKKFKMVRGFGKVKVTITQDMEKLSFSVKIDVKEGFCNEAREKKQVNDFTRSHYKPRDGASAAHRSRMENLTRPSLLR